MNEGTGGFSGNRSVKAWMTFSQPDVLFGFARLTEPAAASESLRGSDMYPSRVKVDGARAGRNLDKCFYRHWCDFRRANETLRLREYGILHHNIKGIGEIHRSDFVSTHCRKPGFRSFEARVHLKKQTEST